MSPFLIPFPELQISFYYRLHELRGTLLLDGLLQAVAESEIPVIDEELRQFVSGEALRRMASWGLRGEIVFAVPYLLMQRPQLVGYYRLLLGFSQKQFYGKEYGFGIFKSMEERGLCSAAQQAAVPELAQCLCASAEYLLREVETLSQPLIHELTLLTLGPQLRGGALNLFGTRATQRVFDLIQTIVLPSISSMDSKALAVTNAAGRIVKVEFSSDPDICIREQLPSGKYRNLVAIEIKGGKDISNIHNRIGEAEKSHQKARKDGFVECWTIIGVASLDMEIARQESPSTDRFYNIDAVTRQDSEEFHDFRENIRSRVGISD